MSQVPVFPWSYVFSQGPNFLVSSVLKVEICALFQGPRMFLWCYVPKALICYGHMFPRSYDGRVLCSQGPIFPEPFVPQFYICALPVWC